MYYNKRDSLLLLTKDNTLKELFRKISLEFPCFIISLQLSINKEDRNIKAIFTDQFYKLNSVSSSTHIERLRKEYPSIPIIVISNGHSHTKDYFKNGADYVLQKPINRLLLEAILYKIFTKLKDSEQVKAYHGMILYIEENYLYYNKCKVFLSEIETHILSLLLDKRTFVKISCLKIFIFRSTGKRVSENNIRVNISRLRIKLKEVSGLNLIMSKYSRGYYISI